MMNKENELPEVSDEVFAKVARELATGKPDEALWTKAFALQNGNEPETKAHYIRLRATQILRETGKTIETEAKPPEDDAPHIAGPWARYFARYLDLALGVCLAVFLVMLLLAAIQPTNVPMTGPVRGISLLIICLILLLPWGIDALMVAMFGNSLGKVIWGITVRHKDGRPLTFKETLNRNFLVCLHGFWTGMTPLTFLPHIFSYNRLKKGEDTKWDAKGNYEVLSSNPGVFRKIVGVSLLIVAFLMLGVMEFGAKIVARKTFDATSSKPDIQEQSKPRIATPSSVQMIPNDTIAVVRNNLTVTETNRLIGTVQNINPEWTLTEITISIVEHVSGDKKAFTEDHTVSVNMPPNSLQSIDIQIQWPRHLNYWVLVLGNKGYKTH